MTAVAESDRGDAPDGTDRPALYSPFVLRRGWRRILRPMAEVLLVHRKRRRLMQSTQSTVRAFDPATANVSTIEKGIVKSSPDTHRSRPANGYAAAAGRFSLHFLEMGIAMGVGMAIFAPVKGVLVHQGYTALLDRSSFDYQFWMNLFMIVPMVLWMGARGHLWRHGIEMSAAMIIPSVCILLLCRLGVTDVLPCFTASLTGVAMFGGMLAYMLYRRDMYTSGYSLRWHRARATYA